MEPAPLNGKPGYKRETITIRKIVFPIIQIGDGRYMSWWKEGSRRRQITASTAARLAAKLERIAIALHNGNVDAAALQPADNRSYMVARETLARWKIPVDMAAREYSAAREIIGADVELLDAARFYKRYAGTARAEKTVAAVVPEFLAAKTAKRVSHAYQEQIKKDLTRFVAAFGARLLGEISATEIDGWLDTVGHMRRRTNGEKEFRAASAFRRNQVRDTIRTFFTFARAREYLPQDRPTAAERVIKHNAVAAGKTVFAPDQLRAFLEACAQWGTDWLPWLAIGAFTGMRTGAILRLDWSAVHWESGVIVVEAAQSKVKERYLAPILPALAAWLLPWREKKAGPIAPLHPPVAKFTQKLERWTCMEWAKGALRSSYISYRYAQTGDAGAVAGECNTSAQEVHQHYRDIKTITGELVTKTLAEKWFSTFPAAEQNVLHAQFRF